MLAFFAPITPADEQDDRRLLLGLNLFPAVVAADQDLAAKRNGKGDVHLLLLYRTDVDAAKEAAKRLAAVGSIKGFPAHVEIAPYSRLSDPSAEPPSALFIVTGTSEDLTQAVRFGIEHNIVVFSPHKGDVTAGAAAGMVVSDRILPLVNKDTLKAAGIRLKPFLLEVARTHE